MTFRDCIVQGKARLKGASLECADPALHIQQIIEAALSLDSSSLLQRWEDEMSEAEQDQVEMFLSRRLKGEPFQYIAGYEWFWDHQLTVGPGVLIPRPETEILVDLALKLVPPGKARIAELGAGSGAIGIALLAERPNWQWVAWENNPQSWPYLQKNLAKYSPTGFTLVKEDFFASVSQQGPLDWYISNPPYVVREELPTLSKEVRCEPVQALDGGVGGREVLERLIVSATQNLTKGGGIILEIGSDQGKWTHQRLIQAGFSLVGIEKDLAGLDRVAYGRWA